MVGLWLPVLGTFKITCPQMLTLATEPGGCTNTVRECALKVDSGGKNPSPHRGGGTRVCRSAPDPTLKRLNYTSASVCLSVCPVYLSPICLSVCLPCVFVSYVLFYLSGLSVCPLSAYLSFYPISIPRGLNSSKKCCLMFVYVFCTFVSGLILLFLEGNLWFDDLRAG